jgi:hypothetical protein
LLIHHLLVLTMKLRLFQLMKRMLMEHRLERELL